VGNPAAHGHAGIRGQVLDEQRTPEDPLGIDFDKDILMEAQGEQAAANSLPALDIHDPELSAVGRFRKSNHVPIRQPENN